jgi:hypothetical protein
VCSDGYRVGSFEYTDYCVYIEKDHFWAHSRLTNRNFVCGFCDGLIDKLIYKDYFKKIKEIVFELEKNRGII